MTERNQTPNNTYYISSGEFRAQQDARDPFEAAVRALQATQTPLSLGRLFLVSDEGFHKGADGLLIATEKVVEEVQRRSAG